MVLVYWFCRARVRAIRRDFVCAKWREEGEFAISVVRPPDRHKRNERGTGKRNEHDGRGTNDGDDDRSCIQPEQEQPNCAYGVLNSPQNAKLVYGSAPQHKMLAQLQLYASPTALH